MAVSSEDAPSATPTAQRSQPRWTLYVLRIIAVVHVAFILVQPVLAGMYLAGNFDMLRVHETNAHILTSVAFAQTVAAVIYAWPGRGTWWPILVSFLVMVVEEVQKFFGYARDQATHIPLGVGLVLVTVLFALWTFTSSARRSRRAGKDSE